VLELVLSCGSFDSWPNLSVHLIKPTFNPQFRDIVYMSLCLWIEDATVYVEVPGRAAWTFCPILSIFGTLSPEIETHPKLVELIRNKLNMYVT